jgi:hypothetical protein
MSCLEPASSVTMRRNFVTSFGNWYQTNDQLNFGGHTKRFAYYVSLTGNRSDYGLQPPIGQVVHDAENGYGGFASLIFNANRSDQFRLVASLRRDYYQIPIDPDPNSAGNQVYPSYGLHDSEREPDGYAGISTVEIRGQDLSHSGCRPVDARWGGSSPPVRKTKVYCTARLMSLVHMGGTAKIECIYKQSRTLTV